MKKAIKIVTILLTIILISMISFFGIYVQKQNRMENIVKGYDLAMDLNGARVFTIKPKEDIKTIIKDTEGNVIEEELTDEEIQEKGYTKEEVNQNQDKLTIENYKQVEDITIKRLKEMKVENYEIKLNEQTGEITIELEENNDTDTIISNIASVGKFEISDSETEEVLINNDNLKEVNVLYGSDTAGTSVYLEIVFNNEGKAKLEEISNTYKTVEDEETAEENTTTEENTATEENTTTEESSTEEETKQKQITMKIDDEEIMTTSFDSPIRTGKLQLNVGKASTDADTVNDYAKRASTIATTLENGKLPLEYEVGGNEYIFSEITNQEIQYIVIGISIAVALALIFLIIKYKMKGVLASFSFIGFVALYLLLIRYANVVISLEGIFGLALILIVNYIFLYTMILRDKDKKEHIKFFLKIIPLCISGIVFCFIEWVPIASLGMILFWGIILMAVYNYAITNPLVNMIGNKE